MDSFLIGTQRTSSNSSFITDSAAAGTALATGHKTINGQISVDVNKKPVGAIGEALKLLGYTVGLVVTTSVGDATPCVWVSHAESRSDQDLIVEQMVGQTHPMGPVADLIIGGGRDWFIGLDQGGKRRDNRSLIEEVKRMVLGHMLVTELVLTVWTRVECFFTIIGFICQRQLPIQN